MRPMTKRNLRNIRCRFAEQTGVDLEMEVRLLR